MSEWCLTEFFSTQTESTCDIDDSGGNFSIFNFFEDSSGWQDHLSCDDSADASTSFSASRTSTVAMSISQDGEGLEEFATETVMMHGFPQGEESFLEETMDAIFRDMNKPSKVKKLRSSEGLSSRHPKIDSSGRSHVCVECGKSYRHYSSVYKHIKSVHDRARHTCRHCGKTFKLKHHLQRHENNHCKAKR